MLKRRARQAGAVLSALGALALVSGCGDDEGDVGPDGPLILEIATQQNGNNQTGTTSEQLENELRVVVTQGEEPAVDVEVRWASSSGGNFSPAVARTDDDGLAVTLWTLGPMVGTQTATASVTDAEGSPVTFTAFAEAPEPPGNPQPPGGPPAARGAAD